ncbi:MAG: polymer-forming cytoskeletal protein [Burkholderiaceae bacterium]|jgi:cytoskeletal protein CcmA (bactofilin family)|nr:polymer-forming cytoskeletal protein [Burkholderiaceae bacterium]
MKYGSQRKALQNIGSVLGTATRVEGTLRLDESVRIDGWVEGNLEQTDGKDRWILIGPRAEVHGDIRAQNVSVAGKVIGNIVASESIELLDGCEVRGNITHKSINVEPGASVHGQLIANDPISEAATAQAIANARSGL